MDNGTRDQIEKKLEGMGCDPVWRYRYWHIYCPSHRERNKSAVCFPDGWIHCFAGCPSRHINSFPGDKIYINGEHESFNKVSNEEHSDFTDFWLTMDLLDEPVKGVPARVLNAAGWRKFPGCIGIPEGIFIPYFDELRERVKFYQVRHDNSSGGRRFSFVPGVRPCIYGMESYHRANKYCPFTEGSRDSIIVRMAGIPCVANPSASGGVLLRELEERCKKDGKLLVAISDRDEAGDKLLSNIRGPFLDMRTPVGKDIGEFYEQEGLTAVKEYYKCLTTQTDTLEH